MAYIKTTWENEPNESTPLNASNLNKIEEGIYQNSLKADQVGDLTDLKTTDKTNIVSAINELKDGEEYSTSEVKTNKVWIDGKTIYRKVYTGTTTSSGVFTVVTDTFDGTVIRFDGTAKNTANNVIYPLVGENGSSGDFIFPYLQGTTIQLVNSNTTKNFEYILIVEYTKTT
jgi:hypothetical protein